MDAKEYLIFVLVLALSCTIMSCAIIDAIKNDLEYLNLFFILFTTISIIIHANMFLKDR